MNYHQPRQIDPESDAPDAGKWRYTCKNGDNIWAEGYCSPWRGCPAGCSLGKVMDPQAPLSPEWVDCPECGGKGVVPVENPCPGHDTPEGAYQHQTEYVLAERMSLNGSMPGQQCPCQVCEAWTQGLAEVDGRLFVLCDEHRTREVVTELFGTVGDSFGSE